MPGTVSLKDIVARTDLALRPLTGEIDDRAVRWVHICELPDPGLYLTGHELLLTAGVDFPTTEPDIDHYVTRLVEVDTAALGFGVTPVYDEVPAALVTACRRHGLPLLEVPAEVSFLFISQTVSLMLAATEREGLRRLSTAQRALTRAAARPDGVEFVVRQLASQLRGWILLTDEDGRRIAGTRVPASPAADVTGLTKLVRAPGGPSSATTHRDGTQVVVQRYDSGAILIAGRATAFGSTERAVLSVGGALLTLLTSAGWRRNQDATAALLSLLTEGGCGQPEQLLATLLNCPTETGWRVIRAVPRGKRGSAAELASALGTPLAAAAVGGGVIAVVPAACSVVGETWLAGTSAAVSLRELPFAARQAETLLSRVKLDGRSRTADAAPGLDGLVDPAHAAAFAGARLAPLSPELLDTLRSWLAHGGSWEPTAESLGVHRNTVRHRLARIAEVLGEDLDDPDVRAELWLALRWRTG